MPYMPRCVNVDWMAIECYSVKLLSPAFGDVLLVSIQIPLQNSFEQNEFLGSISRFSRVRPSVRLVLMLTL